MHCDMEFKKKIKNVLFKLPYGINRYFRLHIYYPLDFIDTVMRRRTEFGPPRSLIRFGGYQRDDETGQEFARYFFEKKLIRPTDSVMDIGCGVGLVAVPVLRFMDGKGRYEGLDVIRESMDWCRRTIGKKFANANFKHIDVFNTSYNPNGVIQGKDYKLPYEDGVFDFIWLKSVFTHMRHDELENYLSEISRVLKVNGKCLITYFLLNGESRELIGKGKSSFNFVYEVDNCLTINPEIPEDAMAYDVDDVVAMYGRHGLSIDEILLGAWCSRKRIDQHLTIQDIVIGRKM